MRIFVTGATGFIGSAVVQELLGAGHAVVGLARSDANAAQVTAAGATAHRGSLEDPDSLARAARDADGVIHTAFIHDFSNIAASGEVDRRAIETIGGALAGSSKPFVIASAIGMLPAGRVTTESDAPDASSGGGHRVASERIALGLAGQGVRSSAIRLPPTVHGAGDHGFVAGLVGIARERGVSAYIGDGANRWPAVHRADAARLFRLALERGVAGTPYHAVAEEGVRTKDIAAAIGAQLALPVVAKSVEEAPAHFTWLARFFAMDVPSSSGHTRSGLGWAPSEPGLLADLEAGHYVR